jgi:hypothetical protein
MISSIDQPPVGVASSDMICACSNSQARSCLPRLELNEQRTRSRPSQSAIACKQQVDPSPVCADSQTRLGKPSLHPARSADVSSGSRSTLL